MEPERESPYWQAIVRDDWPEIPPSAWSALETLARDGAAALNLGDIAAARNDFDNKVRVSERLEQVKDEMRTQQAGPQGFADALLAAADTFGAFAELVRRTRNQILDVVYNATNRIRNETSGDNDGDGKTDDDAEEATDRATTSTIVNEARAEVVDIVANAMASLSPQGLPSLDDIADALGQPGPWQIGPRAPGPELPAPTWPPAEEPGPEEVSPTPVPTLPIDAPETAPSPGLLPGDRITEDTPLPGPDVEQPAVDGNRYTEDIDARAPLSPGVIPAQHTPQSPHGPEAGFGGFARPSAGPSGAPEQPAPVAADIPAAGDASDTAADADVAGAARRTDPEGRDSEKPEAKPETGDQEPSTTVSEQQVSGTPDAAITQPAGLTGAVPPILPQPIATGSTTGPPQNVTAPASQNRPPAPADAQRAQAATSGKPASVSGTAAVPSVSAPSAGKVQPPPIRDNQPVRKAGAMGEDDNGSAELVRDAVGAAIASAASPAFLVGERVDADLVLARTLLGGVLAAVGPSAIGVDWAASVMRHQGGVSAFVTSNEGRGWLPAGLYLPREVSTPWQWAVSEGAAWEGVADPARVLAEFALAWGAKSGAGLSALASSQPIAAALRQQLGQVAVAGSVAASTEMDLRSPTSSTLDRLGLTASQRLLDRAAKVPDGSVALRCLELAVDAHMRVHRAGFASSESLGVADIRLRILRALRHGREFPETWWDELQDIDDLLAAAVLSQRTDVSRVGLGELRSEQPSGRPELAALRELTFHRRCDELALLLSEEPTRQTLRDAVYAHAQIRSHPIFAEQSSRTPPPEPPPQRPTISTSRRP
ncbi:hypothetical protein B0T36_03095 [Nocardia donostiensis]|uniref:hypothetical protein n=1 Tax=Nocardia donostiensis TaxID=1538463 RepID=UPI0009DAFE48|nr:hypothetical protein [Nocardia donostiensis]OQS16673.1 hypothetical protein B0T36_03095 [Nocardia donostiensis]